MTKLASTTEAALAAIHRHTALHASVPKIHPTPSALRPGASTDAEFAAAVAKMNRVGGKYHKRTTPIRSGFSRY